MKKTRYKEEQIIAVLKEVDAGAKLQDVVRRLGVSEQTYYRWKAKFGGMEVIDAKMLKGLEDENRRLKQMVADQALDLQALKAVVSKNGEALGLPPSRRLSPRRVRNERASSLPRLGRWAIELRLPARPRAAAEGRMADQPQALVSAIPC